MDECPSPSRQALIPERIRSSTFSTPAWPLAPSPHRYARPISTTRALGVIDPGDPLERAISEVLAKSVARRAGAAKKRSEPEKQALAHIS